MPALLPSLALLLAACSPAPDLTGETAAVITPKIARPAGDEFSVMTWNLDRFCFDDRNRDGQANEFKPEPEVQAALELIAAEKPDVLACQEIGDGPSFQRLRDELKKRGLGYDHAEQLVRPGTTAHLALLSRHPITATNHVTTESYTIQGEHFPVLHGFLCAEIEVDGRYRFKILVAQLKSKRFAESGQTEMRRNEARLLNKVVRNQLAADTTNQNYIVLGDLGDRPESSALNEALGKQQKVLADLRPLDAAGESWTRFIAADDTYERNDYILCSAAMLPEAVTQKCHVVRGPLVQRASDHRPLTAIFRTRDL